MPFLRMLRLSITLLSASFPEVLAAETKTPVCHVGSVCAAAYSGNGEGCCPYQEAVCCPNKQTCCPKGSTCKDSGSYLTTCVGAAANRTQGLSVCKPGAPLPMSATLKNILIIGDSVSIGYTPWVAKHMSSVALVQHSPWDVRDGGAEETAYGIQCLDYMLRSPTGEFLEPDIIMFNWGLHDGPLGNQTVPGQAGLPSVYAEQLEVVTKKLINAEPRAKFLFALTSPSLCDPIGDGSVVTLNNEAKTIMKKFNISTINLHDAVIGKCGPPSKLSECWGLKGCFCPHCGAGREGQGYDWLATSTIVPGLQQLLQEERGTVAAKLDSGSELLV